MRQQKPRYGLTFDWLHSDSYCVMDGPGEFNYSPNTCIHTSTHSLVKGRALRFHPERPFLPSQMKKRPLFPRSLCFHFKQDFFFFLISQPFGLERVPAVCCADTFPLLSLTAEHRWGLDTVHFWCESVAPQTTSKRSDDGWFQEISCWEHLVLDVARNTEKPYPIGIKMWHLLLWHPVFLHLLFLETEMTFSKV